MKFPPQKWYMFLSTDPGPRPVLSWQRIFTGPGEKKRFVRSWSGVSRISFREKPPLHWTLGPSRLDSVPQWRQMDTRDASVLPGCVKSGGKAAQAHPSHYQQLPTEDWRALRTQTQHHQESQTHTQRPYITAPQNNPLRLLNRWTQTLGIYILVVLHSAWSQ